MQNQGIWRNRLCCSGLCAKLCRMAFECNTVVLQTSLGCTSNKPCLHFRQALPAMRNACVLSGKRQKNAGKACPLYKVLKRHEKAVAPSGGNSVTGMPGVKYFYRAAAWLVVYSPLSGLNAECEKALPIGKNRRVVFVSLAVLGESLLCGDGEKKGVHPVSPCVEALNAHPLAMPSAGIVACYGFPRGRHPPVM